MALVGSPGRLDPERLAEASPEQVGVGRDGVGLRDGDDVHAVGRRPVPRWARTAGRSKARANHGAPCAHPREVAAIAPAAPLLDALLPAGRRLPRQVAGGVDDVDLAAVEVVPQPRDVLGLGREARISWLMITVPEDLRTRLTIAAQLPAAWPFGPPQSWSSRSSAARKWNSPVLTMGEPREMDVVGREGPGVAAEPVTGTSYRSWVHRCAYTLRLMPGILPAAVAATRRGRGRRRSGWGGRGDLPARCWSPRGASRSTPCSMPRPVRARPGPRWRGCRSHSWRRGSRRGRAGARVERRDAGAQAGRRVGQAPGRRCRGSGGRGRRGACRRH